MEDTLALLLSDGYKQVHAEQFPKGLTKLVSYLTPRRSRLVTEDEMVFFGLQAFCQKYLIDYFNDNFFGIDENEVVRQYTRVIDVMLGKGNYNLQKVINLHRLGYLPLDIHAIPEGTMVPMGVPCIEITNTHPDYAWVVQWVESLMSSEMWKPCVHATVGHMYRRIVNKWYKETVDDNIPRHKAISDFGFRGMSCREEATKASAAWLLSFSGTATIPAIPFLEKYYLCNCESELVGTNAISTEHSVMSSNFAVDGDEVTMIRRLLNEIYPHASFSMVSDTYDYWNLVQNILPQVKEDVLGHDGKLLIRPDSGDVVDISVKTIAALWDIFGGSINSKGYKVLDPHIGCVYGDSVTPNRANTIYKRLARNGFASNNIVFGAGSFSFTCYEGADGTLSPYTRDTFNVAVKATAGWIGERYIPIFKDPKTDRETSFSFKKSHRGCIKVFRDEDGHLTFTQGHDHIDHDFGGDAMKRVFCNGLMVTPSTLQEIRKRLNNNDF